MKDRNQVILPIDLGIKIAENDPVRKLIEICDKLDYTELFNAYIRKWKKINPITMFELLVFGYMNRKFSSREIEEACRIDIRFMWILQDESVPDHSTIARFQNERLTPVIEGLFYQVVEKLIEMGEVSYKSVFVDGTKIEANANRYTFVWAKTVEKLLKKLNSRIESELPPIANRYGIRESICPEECLECLRNIAQLNMVEFVSGKGRHKTQLQRDIEKLGDFVERKRTYLMYKGIFNGRKSFSKTDCDATFMRMKEDHMMNGQLKPGYNVQLAVESEYIVGIGLFSNPTDVTTLPTFLERIQQQTHIKIEQIIADAGYESEEN
jgi:transposase